MSLTIFGLVLTLMAWGVAGGTARSWTEGSSPDRLAPALATAGALGLGAGMLTFFHAEGMGLVWGSVLASDFDQYCAAVGAVRRGAFDLVPPQRGIPGAFIPALFARPLGILDGLLATAWLSSTLGFAGLALWARSAFGRGTEAIAAVGALAFVPFGALARMVTFHPLTISLGIATAGLSMAALRYRSNGMWLAGVVGTASLLLLDARGIVSAALPICLLAWMGLFKGTLKHRGARGALLACALLASWWGTGAVVPAEAPGLEHQILRMWEEQSRWAGLDSSPFVAAVRRTHHDEFLWGHRGVAAMVRSMGRLLSMSASLPPVVDARLAGLVGPWFTTGGLALVLAIGLAVRRRDTHTLIGLTLIVPALLIVGSTSRGIAHPRYLAGAVPAVALPLAALYAQVRSTRVRTAAARRGVPAATETLVLLVVGLSLLAGIPATPLSRDASWRHAVLADSEPRDTIRTLAGPNPSGIGRLEACVEALQADHTDGHPYGSTLLGWHPTAASTGP